MTYIYLGTHYVYNTSANPESQLSQSSEFYVHPGFKLSNLANDVALIKLEKPVVYSSGGSLFLRIQTPFCVRAFQFN